jgi:hypothetical protein
VGFDRCQRTLNRSARWENSSAANSNHTVLDCMWFSCGGCIPRFSPRREAISIGRLKCIELIGPSRNTGRVQTVNCLGTKGLNHYQKIDPQGACFWLSDDLPRFSLFGSRCGVRTNALKFMRIGALNALLRDSAHPRGCRRADARSTELDKYDKDTSV